MALELNAALEDVSNGHTYVIEGVDWNEGEKSVLI